MDTEFLGVPVLGEEQAGKLDLPEEFSASGMSPGRSPALLFVNPCLKIPRDCAPEGAGLLIPFIPECGNVWEGG